MPEKKSILLQRFVKNSDAEAFLEIVEGLWYLSGMESLIDLTIYGGNFSGEGFKYLHVLKLFQKLEIVSYKPVQKQAVSQLRRALPELDRFNIEHKQKPVYLKR